MEQYDFSEEKVQILLNEIKHIKERSDAIIEATGENYNFFRVLGIGQDELIFSRMIANLLNPKAAHGFKSRFLQLFIETLCLDGMPDDFDYDKAQIEIEKDIGKRDDKNGIGGRIDIFISIPSNSKGLYGFVIENKIYAGDQNKQLIRYKHYVDDKYKNKNYILYLTLDGREPSEASSGVKQKNDSEEINGFWEQISYRNHISEWIEKCSMEATKFPLLRETLHTFYNQINRLTGQDGAKMTQEELISLLSSDENFAITRLINSNYSKVEKVRAKQLINSIKKKILNENEFNHTERSEIGKESYEIRFDKSKWSKLDFAFSFFYNDLREFKCCILYKNGLSDEEKEVLKKDKKDILDNLSGIVKSKLSNYKCDNTQFSIWRMFCVQHKWIGEKEENAVVDIIHEIINAVELLNK